MSNRASTIFYILSGFVLLTGLFVLSPNSKPEVASLQTEIKTQFSRAWQQTIGDQPYFDDLFAIIDGVNSFYEQSADQTIALLWDNLGVDADIAQVFATLYREFADSFKFDQPEIAGLTTSEDFTTMVPENFMSEEPLYNIVPEEDTYHVSRSTYHETGFVSGSSTQPVNANNSWVTIQDNMTGQLYCLAVYNGEVNKYLGPCKNDYH